MATAGHLDHETILDLLVNVIPLGILAFFSALFLLVNPWGYDPFWLVVTHGLIVIPFTLLAILTYLGALKIGHEGSGD